MKGKAIFAIADTLQIPLNASQSVISGTGNKAPASWPFTMRFPMVVSSDFVKEDEAAVFVHFRGHLWGYIYAKDSGKDTTVWMILFDGGNKTVGTFKTGAARTTLDRLKREQKAILQFTGDAWDIVESITVPL